MRGARQCTQQVNFSLSVFFNASIDFVRFYLFAFHTFSFAISPIITIFMQLLTINATPPTMTMNVDNYVLYTCLWINWKLKQIDVVVVVVVRVAMRNEERQNQTVQFSIEYLLWTVYIWYRRTSRIPFHFISWQRKMSCQGTSKFNRMVCSCNEFCFLCDEYEIFIN